MSYKEDFTKRLEGYGIKVLNNFSVGGNVYEADSCCLALRNEDEQGNEVDSCTIKLSDKDVKALMKSLSFYLKGE